MSDPSTTLRPLVEPRARPAHARGRPPQCSVCNAANPNYRCPICNAT